MPYLPQQTVYATMAIPPKTAPAATSTVARLRPEASFEAEFELPDELDDEGFDPPLAAEPPASDRVWLTPEGATGDPVADPT